jgi:hypothetical protein
MHDAVFPLGNRDLEALELSLPPPVITSNIIARFNGPLPSQSATMFIS